MALLGFDAIGRLALGQLPSAPLPITYGFQQGQTYRVKVTLPQPPAPLNPNLFTNPVPFNQIDWSKPFRLPLALPQPPYSLNPNLFKNPFPFNQADWSKPFLVSNRQPDASRSLNPNLQKNDYPNNQYDWSKAFRVPHITPDASRSLNPNLQKNNYPFPAATSGKVFDTPGPPPPPQPYNQNLYQVVVSVLPFVQGDQSRSAFVPDWLPAPPPPLNINLFTNPVPFGNAPVAAPSSVRALPGQAQPYNQNLYGVVVVSVPFNQTDWSKPFFPKGLRPANDAVNINLFTNPVPFGQTDWSKPSRTPGLNQTPDTLNINLFTNPVPFNQADWSKPQQIKVTQPQPTPPLNINTFTNPVPFGQRDLFAARVPRVVSIPLDAPYNQNIYSVVVVASVPFNQTDWTKPFRLPSAPLPAPGLNINLFTNPFPFGQTDQSQSRPARAAPWPDLPYNQSLYTVTVQATPFNQTDWSKSFRIQRASPLPDPLNINLFTNPFPFAQNDLFVSRIPHTSTPDAPYNQSLYTVTIAATPFNQTDWTKPFFPNRAPLPEQPLNINIFTNPIPFTQTDWARPTRLRSLPDVSVFLNPNVFTNPYPFTQTDVATSSRQRSLPDTSQPYNVGLYGIVTVALPFNQTDWPRPYRPVASPLPGPALNPNLFANPIPFAQYHYPLVQRVPMARFDLSQSLNPNIFVSIAPTIGKRQPMLFISNVGRLMN